MPKARVQHVAAVHLMGVPNELALFIHGQAEATGEHRFGIHSIERAAKHLQLATDSLHPPRHDSWQPCPRDTRCGDT